MAVDVTTNDNGIALLYLYFLILSCRDICHGICKVFKIKKFVILFGCGYFTVILEIIVLFGYINRNNIFKTGVCHFAPNIHLTAGNVYFALDMGISVIGCLVIFIKLLGGGDRYLTAVNLHKVALTVIPICLATAFLQTEDI